MNVSVQQKDTTDNQQKTIRRKVLVVNKDFAQGEVIYKETPIVAALDFDLQSKGTHCAHCLRHIQKDMAIRLDSDRLSSVYCSKDCQVKSKIQSQNLLFSLESPLPADMAAPVPSEDRKKAQVEFVNYLQHVKKSFPVLVARFIARQVAVETAKMIPNPGLLTSDLPETDGGEYTLYDHAERLRYLEIKPSEEEMVLLRQVLKTALPGLEQFVTDERHATLLGKMAYNSYGVCFGGGRDDKPMPTERPEDIERTRTPYGTLRQVGMGFYTVSSYISHSCTPSARPSFSNGTSELHLIANRPLKKGDEITVAYVDVTQHLNESPAESRRRRRMELARGWRFACACSRCTLEGLEHADGTDHDLPSQKDESKVEASVSRAEEGQAPPWTT